MKLIDGGVVAAKGFLANGIHCGIRKNRTKKDLALIKLIMELKFYKNYKFILKLTKCNKSKQNVI